MPVKTSNPNPGMIAAAANEDDSSAHRKKFLWLAYGGWIFVLFLALMLKELGYSEISFFQLTILLALATVAHLVCFLMVYIKIDRSCWFDPHFVYVPNWLFTAPMVAYGYYALGSARGLMQVGWFMGFFFSAGYVRFRGVMLTACWYVFLYLGVLLLAHQEGESSVDFLRESIRSAIFLTVCVFFAYLLDRFAAQKTYLKASVHTLREKDRVITLLNQRLAKFVTGPLVAELAKEQSDALMTHQRRKITVFFSDIQDFSILTDAMEPEELAQLLNEYFAEMIAIVQQSGGTLDKLMGDGLIVLFGAPTIIDPAEGALRCIEMAVNMQERIRVLNRHWRARGVPFPIRVRMGINTGLNIVGSFGSDAWVNYTAIGVQMNIAARLQQIAEPGRILLSHSTYLLVADRVAVKRLGKMSLKGSHYPIEVYQLERLISEPTHSAISWQGQGYSISLQPQILDIAEKEPLLKMLESYLGKPKDSL